jgi:hypothetical protein
MPRGNFHQFGIFSGAGERYSNTLLMDGAVGLQAYQVSFLYRVEIRK